MTNACFIDALPTDLKREIVAHLDLYGIVRIGRVSKSWKALTNEDSIWKLQIRNLIKQNETSKDDKSNIHIPSLTDFGATTWKEAFSMVYNFRWVDGDSDFQRISTINISKNGRVVEDTGEHARYCAVRTLQGFSKGKHYWEIFIDNATSDAYNIYIGICTKAFNPNWNLGGHESWAIRGNDGYVCFPYYRNKPCAKRLRVQDSVGVYLDMDAIPPAICFFVQGSWSEVFRVEKTLGVDLYPAVSMINPNERLELRYPVPIPPSLPTYLNQKFA